MNDKYFYTIDGKRLGPASFEDLRGLAEKGELKQQSKVWCLGMKEWQLASSVPHLFDDLPPDLESELTSTAPSLPPSHTEPNKGNPTTSSEANQPKDAPPWGCMVVIGLIFGGIAMYDYCNYGLAGLISEKTITFMVILGVAAIIRGIIRKFDKKN